MGRRNHPRHPPKRYRGGLPTRKEPRPDRTKCGKVGYRSKDEALEWLHRLSGSKARHGLETREQRVYLCPVCPGWTTWHTTSQEERER